LIGPALILLSYELVGKDMVSLVKEIHASGTSARVVVYNAPEALTLSNRLFEAGISGYVLKNDPCSHILAAVHTVVQNKLWFSPTLGAQAIKGGMMQDDLPALNESEQKILGLLAQGLGNKEIAARLMLAQSTVKNVVSTLYGILGATNRGQLVLLAVELSEKFSTRKAEGGRGWRR
jgi:DNA-binding NarL/FixJ family response regulator